MALKKLYNPIHGVMRIAGFMSGTGSNLIKIIDHSEKLKAERGNSPYEVVAVFSDVCDCNANFIGKEKDLPVITRDLAGFYAKRGLSSTIYKENPKIREEFDKETRDALSPYFVNAIALGGYMSKVTYPLLNEYLIVNVHPADLSIMSDGKRKFKGEKTVFKAIQAQEKEIRSTTHIVDPKIDNGEILMISSPIEVKLEDGFDVSNDETIKFLAKHFQDRLKKFGDHVIFPRTMEYIADGRFAKDEKDNLYFDDNPIPQGIRL